MFIKKVSRCDENEEGNVSEKEFFKGKKSQKNYNLITLKKFFTTPMESVKKKKEKRKDHKIIPSCWLKHMQKKFFFANVKRVVERMEI